MHFHCWRHVKNMSRSLRAVFEHSTALYRPEMAMQPWLRAGTGPFAAIFCPTKQPSQEGNQPGLHCRFVPGSGQWLLTDFSLARMEMSVSVWFFICCRSGWGLLIRKYPVDETLKISYYLTFRPRPCLAMPVWQRTGHRGICRLELHWIYNENISKGHNVPE